MVFDSAVQSLYDLAEEINKEVDIVFVEGIKDKKALEKIGVIKKILYATNSIEESYNKKVAILTDFDREGIEIRKRLVERLNGKVFFNKTIRGKLRKILTPLGRRDIESINNLCKEV